MGVMGLLAGGAGVSIIISGIDKFSNVFKKAGVGMKALGGVMKTVGTGAVIVGAAVAGIGIAAAKSAAKVETGFAKVNTLLDEGQNATDLFGDSVKRLNVTLGNQGDQLTVLDGLYQTISAGITDTADAEKFLESATRAAVGGSAQLPIVIEAGTKAIAAFGLSVNDSDKVFDIFAATVKAGQTTMEQLAGAFPRVSGSAGELGITLEETAGVFAGLTKVMKSPEEAATSLNAVMTGLVKPSTDLKNTLKDMGYESSKTALDSLGLMGTLQKLKIETGGDAEAMGKLFGNVRALRAIFPALGKASDDVANSMEIINNSTGIAQKQFEDMAETSEYKLGTAMSTLKNKFIDFGAKVIPIFTDKLLPALEPLIDTFTNKILPAIEPIIPLIADGLVKAVNLLLPVFQMLLPHLERFSKMFFEKILPMLEPLINLLLELVDTALIYFMDILEALIPVFEALLPAIIEIVKALMPLLDIILPPLIELLELLTPLLVGLIGFFADLSTVIINTVVKAIKTLVGWLTDAWEWLEKILGGIGDVGSGIGDFIGSIGDFFGGGKVRKVNDFILTNSGQVLETNPNDTIIGTKNPGGLGGGIIINIDNVYGLNPDMLAEALQDKLSEMITI